MIKNLYKYLVFLLTLNMFPINQIVADTLPPESLYSVPTNWIDDSGAPFALNSLRGLPVVITMAYTTCRSACPITMQRLRKIDADLQKAHKKIQFAVISLDSDLDSPELLRRFRKEHGVELPHWHLLIGQKDQTRLLSNLLTINFQKNENSGEIMHSNRLILLDAQGVIKTSVEGLSSDLRPLVEAVSNSSISISDKPETIPQPTFPVAK